MNAAYLRQHFKDKWAGLGKVRDDRYAGFLQGFSFYLEIKELRPELPFSCAAPFKSIWNELPAAG